MTCHTFHPDTHTHGLADGCPRCAEHAQNPRAGLDALNLDLLMGMIRLGLEPRSENEARAMANLRASE